MTNPAEGLSITSASSVSNLDETRSIGRLSSSDDGRPLITSHQGPRIDATGNSVLSAIGRIFHTDRRNPQQAAIGTAPTGRGETRENETARAYYEAGQELRTAAQSGNLARLTELYPLLRQLYQSLQGSGRDMQHGPLDARSAEGYTALDLAVRGAQFDAVTSLLQHGADPGPRGGRRNMNTFDHMSPPFVRRRTRDQESIYNALAGWQQMHPHTPPAPTDWPPVSPDRPLRDTDIGAVQKQLRSSVKYVRYEKFREAARELYERNGRFVPGYLDACSENDGLTALASALSRGNEDMVKSLLDWGADPTLRVGLEDMKLNAWEVLGDRCKAVAPTGTVVVWRTS